MKRSTHTLTVVSLIAALGTGAAFATGALNFPDEVKSSSIKLPRGIKKAQLDSHAKIDRPQAEAAALAALPGQVVKARLDDENGYLVWQIDVRHAKGVTEVAVDAGNGRVLAMEEEGDESRVQETVRLERP